VFTKVSPPSVSLLPKHALLSIHVSTTPRVRLKRILPGSHCIELYCVLVLWFLQRDVNVPVALKRTVECSDKLEVFSPH
jgi:hypothetical protein